MHLGVIIRNMGESSTPELLARCVLIAEEAGFESAWLTDHIAIPPDDAETSGGRYLDPLVTLSWFASKTRRIKLGVSVLILPYRSALPTIKQIASLQELSGGRLLLGVGVGWMEAEFRALGIKRSQRGRLTDATLNLMNRCWESDTVTENGQTFLFKPRPKKPLILVGGGPPHALARAARYGDGWLPMGLPSVDELEAHLETYRGFCSSMKKPVGGVTLMGVLPMAEIDVAVDQLAAYARVGVDRFICSLRYENEAQYREQLDRLRPLVP
jgi:probable F420-dependent oxidoreductase